MIRPTREETKRYLEDFSRLVAESGRVELAKPLEPLVARCAAGLFRLVVVGEIKKGKTSFINALLGMEDLLPVSSDVATSTVFKIHYGPERRIRVFFLPPSEGGGSTGVREPQTITPGELADYGTEDGNPDNEKGVDFISVEAPHSLLKEGLAVIDTPGLGGLFRKHADITWRYIPNADAVFFALDSVEAVMTRDETEFLKRLRGFTERLFFVQTKTDAAEEGQWRAWAERNQAIIAEALGAPVGRHAYFPVSAKLKLAADKRASPRHLQRSGFLPLLDFIHHRLMPAKDSLLGKELLLAMTPILGQLWADAEAGRAIAQADSREKLLALEKEFKEAQARLETWTRTQWPQAFERFQADMAKISTRAMRDLSERLEPMPMGALMRRIMDPLRDDPSVTAPIIAKRAEEWQNQCGELCAREVMDVVGEVQRSLKTAWLDAMASVMPEKNGPDMGESSMNGFSISGRGEVRLGSDESTWSEYALAGLPALTTGMAALFVATIPPLAIAGAVAAAVAGIWRTRNMEAKRAEQQKREALGQLQSLLVAIIQQSHKQASYRINDWLGDMRRKTAEAGREMAESMRRAVDGRMAEIQEARQRPATGNKAAADQAAVRLQALDALLTSIRQVCAPSASGKGGAPAT